MDYNDIPDICTKRGCMLKHWITRTSCGHRVGNKRRVQLNNFVNYYLAFIFLHSYEIGVLYLLKM